MLPDRVGWDEIKALYEKARYCLWGQRHARDWFYDEENGMYYLWSAYHYATLANGENTDHLTSYARILAMMAFQLKYKEDDYNWFHKYVEPSVREYGKAIAAGQKVGNKEYERIQFEKDVAEYEIRHEYDKETVWKEAYEIIENGQLLKEKEFFFHDSKPVYFKQTSGKQAVLKLYYDNLLAVFRFDNVNGIRIDTDTDSNWVEEGYCYRMQGLKNLKFNAGDYTITCDHAALEKLVDFNEYALPDPEAICQDDPNAVSIKMKRVGLEKSISVVGVERIIELTNEILTAGGLEPSIHPILSGEPLQNILESGDSSVIYRELLRSQGMASSSRLIWMKFTDDGHLGEVVSGNSIHFDDDTDASGIIASCGLKWDPSFVLVFPLVSIPGCFDGFRQGERKRMQKIKTAVVNYLSANKVPVLDKGWMI